MLCLSAPSPLNTNTVGRDHAPGWLSRCQRFPALPGYAPGSSGPSSRGQLQSSAWQAAHRAGRVKVLRGQSHPHAWQSHIGVPFSDTSIVFFSHAHRAALPRHPKVGFRLTARVCMGNRRNRSNPDARTPCRARGLRSHPALPAAPTRRTARSRGPAAKGRSTCGCGRGRSGGGGHRGTPRGAARCGRTHCTPGKDSCCSRSLREKLQRSGAFELRLVRITVAHIGTPAIVIG